MNLIKLSLLVLFLFVVAGANAQNVLKLTKNDSGKTRIFKQGARVVYKVQEDSVNVSQSIIGKLEAINDTSITISGNEISLDSIVAFGQKRKGSGFSSMALGITGGYLAGYGLGGLLFNRADDDSSNVGVSLVGFGLGAGLVAWAFNIDSKNSAKDVIGKWKLEVVGAK